MAKISNAYIRRDPTKAKIFTVLDAKIGFHQVKLDDANSHLTTSGLPLGAIVIYECHLKYPLHLKISV